MISPFTLSSTTALLNSSTSLGQSSLLLRSPQIYHLIEETVTHYSKWLQISLVTTIPSELFVMFFDEVTMRCYTGLFGQLMKVSDSLCLFYPLTCHQIRFLLYIMERQALQIRREYRNSSTGGATDPHAQRVGHRLSLLRHSLMFFLSTLLNYLQVLSLFLLSSS